MPLFQKTGALCIFAGFLWAAQPPAPAPDQTTVLDHIRTASLRGHVSFLASDALEGRGTPSKGLEIAAEYIAAQFRRAGLEPLEGSYFQNAAFVRLDPVREGLRLEFGERIVPSESLVAENSTALALRDQPAVKYGDKIDLQSKVVIISAASPRELFRIRQRIADSKPAALIYFDPEGRIRERPRLLPADALGTSVPAIAIRDRQLAAEIDQAPAGPLPFQISLTLPAPRETPVTLRNVAGVLPGSDPVLKDTYELVTAHYDHLGVQPTREGTRIYNGANDDASGTASLIEIAEAVAGLNPRPKRSILFLALFGEELGLLGSRYYAAHPLAPLNRTIADVNLEHLGRTDSNDGPHPGMVNFTGFDFSDVPQFFKRAGQVTGIRVVKDEKNSDSFFARSDNQALADAGIPAHTISVTYEFPDYHQPGDHWDRIDYDNMAKVDRMIALGVLFIADSPVAPAWNPTEPKAAKYLEAGRKLHAE